MHTITLSQDKAAHLLRCKALLVDPNGSYQRNMVLRRIYNKAVKADDKPFEIDFSNADLTHFRNGIIGGILRKDTTDREAGHLMACADALRIPSWVEGLIPKMNEEAECKLPLDGEENQGLDDVSIEGQEG